MKQARYHQDNILANRIREKIKNQDLEMNHILQELNNSINNKQYLEGNGADTNNWCSYATIVVTKNENQDEVLVMLKGIQDELQQLIKKLEKTNKLSKCSVQNRGKDKILCSQAHDEIGPFQLLLYTWSM